VLLQRLKRQESAKNGPICTFLSASSTLHRAPVGQWARQGGNSRLCLAHREKKNQIFFALTREKQKPNPPKPQKNTKKNKKKYPQIFISRLRAEKKSPKKTFALTREKIIISLAHRR